MSKRADEIRASAASLADLEDEFGTPASKQYPPVKSPANTQPAAPAKPAAVVVPAPAPVAEAPAPVVEAKQVAATPEAPAANAEERGRRRGGKGAAKAQAQRLPPSRADKVPINVWTSADKRRALKIHAVSEGTTIDELMTEALDDLIKKRRIRVG